MSFLSVTGRDLNRERQALAESDPMITPSKKNITSNHSIRVLQEKENLLSELAHDTSYTLTEDHLKDRHFERISERVNTSIKELKQVYNIIGYSSTETAIKSSEIFNSIEDTILQFVANVQREKGNIENECEWLRQQIRIILAMIDDSSGETTLSLSRQGLVYNDVAKYENGFRQEIQEKLRSIEEKKSCFYASSPFNLTSTTDTKANASQFQDQYQQLLQNVPKLTLLQQKNSLNKIFLDVLVKFVDVFDNFNELNLIRHEIVEIVGPIPQCIIPESVVATLPLKAVCEEFKELIDSFKKITNAFDIQKASNISASSNSKNSSINGHNPNNIFDLQDSSGAFIVSSPCKNQKSVKDVHEQNQRQVDLKSHDTEPKEKPEEVTMDALRDINYKLVRAIRGLKITRITYQLIDQLQEEVERSEIMLNSRMLAMNEIISKCFEFIEVLYLSDDQFMSIQRKFEMKTELNAVLEAIDIETLRFIQRNSKEFGLSDKHFDYVNGIADILQKLKDNRQSRWDYYHDACVPLWEKLGELQQYMVDFVSANATLEDSSILNFKHEYAKLCSKRLEFVDSFIADARTDIHNMWKKLKMTRNQCAEFKHYDYDSHSRLDKELVLKEHEDELKRLQEEYAAKEDILQLNTQLGELLEDQKFLIESSKDSSRLLSKNSCKILLNEEKLRKKIIKLLPATIKSLKAAVVQFNNDQLNKGLKPMTLDGEDFFERLIVIESEHQANSSKKPRGSKTPVSSVASKLKQGSTGSGVSPHRIIKNSTRSPVMKSPSRSSPLNLEHRKRVPLHALKNSQPSSLLRVSISPKKETEVKLAPLSQPLTVRNMSNIRNNSNRQFDNLSSFSETSMSSRYSPSKSLEGTETPLLDDKENSFSLSPIKASDFMKNERFDSMLYNNSTLIGDDYQRWRNEKIKELNHHDA